MRALAMMALLAGCSEYEMAGDRDPAEGTTVDPLAPGGGGTAGEGDDGFSGGGGSGTIPEEFTTDDCSDGIVATWLSGEVAVLAHQGPGVGQVDVPESGVYDVYDLVIAESGASQWNESAYIRIPTQDRPDGTPMVGNCGEDWVVEDSDNLAPVTPGTTQYLGRFWLPAGVQDVEVRHYCELYDAGECISMHNDDDPGSTCETNNPNSVHVTGEALCLRPV